MRWKRSFFFSASLFRFFAGNVKNTGGRNNGKEVRTMNQVTPIEGITPTSLWNAVVVLLGLCAVVVLVYKVIEIARKVSWNWRVG